MSSDLPSYADIEKALHTEPLKVLSRLPDTTETRSAKRLLETVYSYAREARERVKPA